MRTLLAVLILTLVVINVQSQTITTARAINFKEVMEKIEYPKDAYEQMSEGNVTLLVTISEKGLVKSFKVKNMCDETFVDAVAREIYELRFVPATAETGEAVECKLEIPFEFRLQVSSTIL